MKTIQVAVNKSQERPDGVQIEVIDPETQLEQQTLAYLLNGFVRDASARGTFKLDLPENFTVAYQREGSFLLSSGPSGPNVSGASATYYSPGKPLAVMAIHKLPNRFDVVYGEILPPEKRNKPAEAKSDDAPKTDEPAKDSKAEDKKADDKPAAEAKK